MIYFLKYRVFSSYFLAFIIFYSYLMICIEIQLLLTYVNVKYVKDNIENKKFLLTKLKVKI